MEKKKKRIVIFSIIIIFVISVLFLKESPQKTRDYPEIRKEGILRIVTSYNSIDYYVSGDSVQGFQYELCKSFEKYSGLKVVFYLENNLSNIIKELNNKKYDIIANNIPIIAENRKNLAFTQPIMCEKQVLVQRKQEYNSGVPPIRNQIDLAGKTIYVPEDSPNLLRLRNLSEEIADTIYIIEEKQYNAEQLIYMVVNGDIDYAVTDRQIALTNIDKYPQLDIKTDITFTQIQAWAVRKDSPVLLDSLNNWLDKFKSTKEFQKIKNKYFNTKPARNL